ncbi:type I secretion C-terminal target domain-containing protein [Pseudoduganella namucuonensis]|uniref:Type I secretion C-terminal target domain (VC_A0849 subclass) n=1 Tax=Pseudoduganella namucuonensis TaxID=1035707 RepID=A0A1I7M578_9BURK|nr:type I secretion C-terminal target domain-containing protein [Pseudoduganella namucuonensis]SFV17092.1 type I secretion C-terminal target domain (VC_A0849 subclass) [Pseudoduganella namucuonensis]
MSTVPTLVSYSPSYYATGVAVDANIVLRFSGEIQAGSGNLIVRDNASRIVTQESIGTSPRITISGATLTLDLPANLAYSSRYTVDIPYGLVKDLAGSPVGYWFEIHFQTEYSTAPVTLLGSGGADLLEGGLADDVLEGGGGDDSLGGYHGNDTLRGGLGDDNLDGGKGDDSLDGGDGDDELADSDGHNFLCGGAGNDSFYTYMAYSQHSVLDGGAGNDYFHSNGQDTIEGGAGNDTISLSDEYAAGGSAVVSGGDGEDRIEVEFYSAANTSVIASGGGGVDTFLLPRRGNGDDMYVVTDFQAGAGGDLIDLWMIMLWSDARGNPFRPGGYMRLTQDGADTLVQELKYASATEFYTVARLAGVRMEQVTAANFVGGLDPAGTSKGMTVYGTAGNDRLLGYVADDTLYGLQGFDTLDGQDGNDLLDGGTGLAQDAGDELWGGEGNDSLLGGNGSDTMRGEEGDDVLEGGADDDFLEEQYGNNILRGGAGNDTLSSTAIGAGLYEGDDGADSITGGYGNDTLSGGAGNDSLNIRTSGGQQASHTVQVFGGEGDDLIQSWLYTEPVRISANGGAGADLFVFKGVNMVLDYTITDFSAAEGDRIDLRGALPSNSSNPFGPTGYLAASQDGNDMSVWLDRDGAAGAQYAMTRMLTLKGVSLSSLSAATFVGNFTPVLSVGRVLDGTPGNDVLQGAFLNDIIKGGDGADTIYGGKGDDIIDGGDETLAGTGDQLYGEAGNDALNGGAGKDYLTGADGNDTLSGGNGDDQLTDTLGDNVLLGGAGDDALSSGGEEAASHDNLRGASRLEGGEGNDTLTTYQGDDTLIGGTGDDTFFIAGNYSLIDNAITLQGGDGNDVIQFRGSNRTGINTSINATGGAGTDTYQFAALQMTVVISDFVAGNGGDVLDVVALMESSAFRPPSGNPFGALGYLRLQQSGADALVQYDRDGAAGSSYSYANMLTLRGVTATNLTVANFTQGISPSGSNDGLMLLGSGAKDKLTGGLLNDTIVGNGEADVLAGGPGNDQVEGGEGNDFLLGDDEISYSGENDVLLGGAGDDVLLGNFGNDTLSGDDGNDRLSGQAGDDQLSGGAGSDDLYDDSGNNALDGGGGDDYLSAGAGDDTIVGGAGNDSVNIWTGYGGSGVLNTVVVDCGDGDDIVTYNRHYERASTVRVTGGAGSDTYVLGGTKSSGTFIVADFAVGAGGDRIDVLKLLGTAYEGPNPFVAGGLLKLVQRGADTVLRYDFDGTGVAPHQDLMVLQGVSSANLTGENFVGHLSPDGASTGMTLAGGAAGDSLSGGFLDDTMNGGDGVDYLSGNAGDDMIYGDAGNDYLRGDKGNDVLAGGAGDDDLSGGVGDDRLDGGSGNDGLSDFGGSNVLSGGAGNDKLDVDGYGGSSLFGGDGNDTLFAGNGTDTLDGGAGDDVLSVLSYGGAAPMHAVVVVGGEGEDHIAVQYISALTLAVTASGGGGRDTFNVGTGSPYEVSDFVAGDQGDRIGIKDLFGWPGPVNPFMEGKLGLVQSGADTLLRFDGGGNVQTTGVTVLVLRNVLASTLTARNFVEGVDPRGITAARDIAGDGWIDMLAGGALDDVLSGGGGADLMYGGGGNDRMSGDEGSDLMYGNDGVDTAVFSGNVAGYRLTYNGGSGDWRGVSVQDLDPGNGDNGRDGLLGFEVLQFADRQLNLATFGALRYIASHADLINLYKDSPDGGLQHYIEYGFQEGRAVTFDPAVYLANYADLRALYSGDLDAATRHYINFGYKEGRSANADGDDAFAGTAGADTLRGYGGNDTLTGHAGNDVLDGGAGIDTAMFGGAVVGYKLGYAGGVVTVRDTDLANGDEGTDTLSGVERLRFADKLLDLGGFNALNYLASYGDLINVFKADANAALGHYISNGFQEGRGANFDAAWYLTHNADLGVAFGGDLAAVTRHYITDGYKEGRAAHLSGSADVDLLRAGAGDDVLTGNGGNDALQGGAGTDTAMFGGAASGYKLGYAGGVVTVRDTDLANGDEGTDTLSGVERLRFADKLLDLGGFNALNYLASYGDLINVFKTDANAALGHYISNGFQEGRGANFDAAWYLAHNADLGVAFGGDLAAVTRHYITDGYKEGRAAHLNGSADADLLRAGAGDDVLTGNGGNDALHGGAGMDTAMFGGAVAGYKLGYAGGVVTVQDTDLANGDEGTDTLSGVERLRFADKLLDLGGFNALTYVASYGDLIGVFKTDANAALGHYISNGFQEGRGASFDAAWYLARYADLGAAFGGDLAAATRHYITDGYKEGRAAHLNGSGGADLLRAGAGDDVLTGNGGNDALHGGAGTDTAMFGGAVAGYKLSYAGGVVTVWDTDLANGDEGTDTLSGVERLRFADKLLDLGGFNALSYVASYGDLIGVFKTDANAALGHYISNGFQEGRGASFDAAWYLARYADLGAAFGGDLAAVTRHYITDGYKEGRAAQLNGSAGTDLLRAGAGNDMLNGYAGNDNLFGNAGNDTLAGGLGGDTLTGGAGGDSFVFDSAPGGENIDTLVDFSSGTDVIVLDDDIFTAFGAVQSTALAVTAFVAGTAALDADDRIIYDQASGKLYYDSDGSGALAQQQIALIGTASHPALSAGSMLIRD